jgi:hypothetical protein
MKGKNHGGRLRKRESMFYKPKSGQANPDVAMAAGGLGFKAVQI